MLPTVRKSTRIVKPDESEKIKEVKKIKLVEKSSKPEKIEPISEKKVEVDLSPRKSSRNAQKSSKVVDEEVEELQKEPVAEPEKAKSPPPAEVPLKVATPSPKINLSNVKITPKQTFKIVPYSVNFIPFKSPTTPQSPSGLKISSVKGSSIVISNAKMVPLSASGFKFKAGQSLIIKPPSQPIKMEKITPPTVSQVQVSMKTEKLPQKVINQAKPVKVVKITQAGKVVMSKNQTPPEAPYESRRSGLRGVKININDLLGRKSSPKKLKTPPKASPAIIQIQPFVDTVETYICKKCPLVFNTRKDFMLHRRSHKKSDFECDKCHSTFRFLNSFNNHNCDFFCTVCRKSISNKANLKIHMSYVHGIGDAKLFSCDLCARTYKSKRNIDSHMKNHMIETPHNCSICGKGFSHRGALKIHMWNHRDVVECPQCARKFKPRSLYYHIKKCQGLMYTTRRKNSLKIVNVMEMEEEREEVEEEVMFEEYIEEYEDDDDNRLQWNYGVEVIKNEKN